VCVLRFHPRPWRVGEKPFSKVGVAVVSDLVASTGRGVSMSGVKKAQLGCWRAGCRAVWRSVRRVNPSPCCWFQVGDIGGTNKSQYDF